MDTFQQILDGAISFIPTAATILVVIILLAVARTIINRRFRTQPGQRFHRQTVTGIILFVGLIVLVLVIPLSEGKQGQLLGLIGILVSAVIALSSATFMGNILAGMMLSAIKNIRPGNFVQVGEHFGRVSGRGLFHVEIQTEDRDLTTLPNMYLVTNPVRVTQESGTIVTAEVSLGYDLPRTKIESALKQAALDAGLTDPFVHILNLNDFSVTYRVAGMLEEVKNLISTRSRLREAMLDQLHQNEIEIVSPTFMNTRAIQPGIKYIPFAQPPIGPTVLEPEKSPEDVAFDKANEAESLEKLRERYAEIDGQIAGFKESLAAVSDDAEKKKIQEEMEILEHRRERLAAYLKAREEREKK